MRRLGAVLAAAVATGSCFIGGGTHTVTAIELRSAVVGLNFGALDANTRAAIEHGTVWPGATEAMLYVSRGEPRVWWHTRIGQNLCRVLVHHGASPAFADLSVTTCGGVVVQAIQIKPPLPCWRLAEVGPRIAASVEYFEGRPIETQWQIVIGLLHRGQVERDVEIAFGTPYNRGFDEREDGKRAEQLVFLDRTKDAYGLNVTLIDNKVVAWKMSAERRLTPEAEQRRLAAMEKRLTARLADLEALAIKNHAEEVRLFGEVMDKQDQMLEELSEPPPAMPPPDSASAGPVASSNGGAPSMEDIEAGGTTTEQANADGGSTKTTKSNVGGVNTTIVKTKVGPCPVPDAKKPKPGTEKDPVTIQMQCWHKCDVSYAHNSRCSCGLQSKQGEASCDALQSTASKVSCLQSVAASFSKCQVPHDACIRQCEE